MEYRLGSALSTGLLFVSNLRSLAILEKALGKDHPNTKQARDNLEALQAAKTK